MHKDKNNCHHDRSHILLIIKYLAENVLGMDRAYIDERVHENMFGLNQ